LHPRALRFSDSTIIRSPQLLKKKFRILKNIFSELARQVLTPFPFPQPIARNFFRLKSVQRNQKTWRSQGKPLPALQAMHLPVTRFRERQVAQVSQPAVLPTSSRQRGCEILGLPQQGQEKFCPILVLVVVVVLVIDPNDNPKSPDFAVGAGKTRGLQIMQDETFSHRKKRIPRHCRV